MRITTPFFRLMLCTFIGFSLLGSISCNSSRPQKECTTFEEMKDPTNDTLSDWSNVPAGLHASFISIDDKLPKSVAPEITPVNNVKVSGWKGEKVAAQMLLWAAEDIRQVECVLDDFANDENTLPASVGQA